MNLESTQWVAAALKAASLFSDTEQCVVGVGEVTYVFVCFGQASSQMWGSGVP